MFGGPFSGVLMAVEGMGKLLETAVLVIAALAFLALFGIPAAWYISARVALWDKPDPYSESFLCDWGSDTGSDSGISRAWE